MPLTRRKAREIGGRRNGHPDELPVSEARETIMATIRDHQVVIVAGTDGSVKTTQLPKLLLAEMHRGRDLNACDTTIIDEAPARNLTITRRR